MPRSRKIAGVAGLCAIALAATAAPVTMATATADDESRTVGLLDGATRGTTDKAGERSRAARLDIAALGGLREGDTVELALLDDATVTAAIDDRTTADGVTSWTGALIGDRGTFTAVEVDGVAHVNVFSAEEGSFEIASTREGGYEVVEVPQESAAGDDAVREHEHLGGDHADHADHADHDADHAGRTDGASSPTASGAPGAPVAADAPSTIDIAIVYPASLPATTGEAAMRAQFAQGIAQTNQALAASGIGTQVRLVGTRQVAATQSTSLMTNYTQLATPNDGIFDEAQALREETHADLVSMWLGGAYPSGSFCGLGSLGGTQPEYDPESAAWTVMWADQCATGTLTFTHEIGHNLSADHDASASSPPEDSKPYARGYVDVAGNFRTVMAYPTACTACTRIGYYSNPGVAYNGRPTGTAGANNAQAIAEQINAVANYRQSQIYPSAVAISGSARFKGTAKADAPAWLPAVTLSYQWYLGGNPVPGATGTTYKPGRSAIGQTLGLVVTGSAPYYAPAQSAAAGVVVGKASFKTKRPKLRGVPRAGRVLSVKLKGWKPNPGKKSVKVRYQWMRNDKLIKGAKKASYRLGRKDRGKKVSVVVKVRAKNYETTTRSSKKVKVRR